MWCKMQNLNAIYVTDLELITCFAVPAVFWSCISFNFINNFDRLDIHSFSPMLFASKHNMEKFVNQFSSKARSFKTYICRGPWICSTSYFLISFVQMTNTIQKKFKVSSTQLLYQSSPYQAMTLFISGPFLDKFLTQQNVFAFRYTPQVLVTL